MKSVINHEVYGEIVYNENFLTGKKSLTVNDNDATPVSKTTFTVNDLTVKVSGNYLTGVNLIINDEVIEITAKPKVYEFILALLPFAFNLIWGNSVVLCSIFPVVGGGVGGGIGTILSLLSLSFMQKTKNPLLKILIGVAVLVANVLLSYFIALAMLGSLA